MGLIQLNRKYIDVARAQNAPKRRIAELEDRIKEKYATYDSDHGLILGQMWSEAAKIEQTDEAQARITAMRGQDPNMSAPDAEVWYVADQLLRVRREEGQKRARLLGGSRRGAPTLRSPDS